MLIVLSPAKTLDYESPLTTKKSSEPMFVDRAQELVDILAGSSPQRLADLMSISDQLAELNFERFQDWEAVHADTDARPAVLAFKGDVYQGLEAETMTARDLNHAQRHLRILSGLYGVLRPLDLMQPYRLEMGSKLANPAGENLYDFWRDTVTETLQAELDDARPKALINLASKEYFSAVDTDKLDAKVISPVFKDHKNGSYKVISFFAKKARGRMASWIIRERVSTLKGLRDFDVDGYRFSPDDSTTTEPVYLRD